jgi:hypothetical protein
MHEEKMYDTACQAIILITSDTTYENCDVSDII